MRIDENIGIFENESLLESDVNTKSLKNFKEVTDQSKFKIKQSKQKKRSFSKTKKERYVIPVRPSTVMQI